MPSFVNTSDKNDYTDQRLRFLIFDRYSPDEGYRAEELLKLTFTDWETSLKAKTKMGYV